MVCMGRVVHCAFLFVFSSGVGARSETSTRVRKADGYDTDGVRYVCSTPTYLYNTHAHTHTHTNTQWSESSRCAGPHLQIGLPSLLRLFLTPSCTYNITTNNNNMRVLNFAPLQLGGRDNPGEEITPEMIRKQMTDGEFQKIFEMSQDRHLYQNLISSLFPTIHGQ